MGTSCLEVRCREIAKELRNNAESVEMELCCPIHDSDREEYRQAILWFHLAQGLEDVWEVGGESAR